MLKLNIVKHMTLRTRIAVANSDNVDGAVMTVTIVSLLITVLLCYDQVNQ